MVRTLEWDGESLLILNQVELPFRVDFRRASRMADVVEAIRRLEVRGAPAIGIAAAFGYVLGIREYNPSATESFGTHARTVYQTLAAARPTAVNLCWALEQMESKLMRSLNHNFPSMIEPGRLHALVQELTREAQIMLREDARINRSIGQHGQKLISDGAHILTHCNTGALAASEFGTALGVMRAAHAAGKQLHIYVDETRPLLQGARLTAWELLQEGIPFTLITDNMAGFLMYQNKVDIVLVGADRIAANGDTANKIGTYSLAVLAREHGIPFYIVAPLSSIDVRIEDGSSIVIEERNQEEVRKIGSQAITLPEIPVYNPAFDITPAKFISGIITEEGIIEPPFVKNILLTLMEQKSAKPLA